MQANRAFRFTCFGRLRFCKRRVGFPCQPPPRNKTWRRLQQGAAAIPAGRLRTPFAAIQCFANKSLQKKNSQKAMFASAVFLCIRSSS